MSETQLVKKQSDFSELLEKWKPEIARALPSHLSAERMCRIALTSYRRTPGLARCEPVSVFAAVIQAAQLGLEPDLLGRAYLIPYKRTKKVNGQWTEYYECQFVPGWKGLVELLNRDGRASVRTGAVYDGDVFEFELGTGQRLRHVPCGEDSAAKMVAVYAIGQVRGNDVPYIEVWPTKKIWSHRNQFNKVGDSHYSYVHAEMYARKVVLLQVLKYLPLSAELSQAVALEYAAQTRGQSLDLASAASNTWTPESGEDGEEAVYREAAVNGHTREEVDRAVAENAIESVSAPKQLAGFDGDEPAAARPPRPEPAAQRRAAKVADPGPGEPF